MEAPISEPLFTRRKKMLSRPDGFMLYGKLGVDFFSTSELLYPNMKNRLRLIRATPNFYMISDNPNVSLGIVDCSLYTRRIALKHDHHKERMDMPTNTPVEFNYIETLARTFIIPATRNQFIQKKFFSTILQFVGLLPQWINTLPSVDFTLKIHSGINNFHLRQFKILTRGQPIVEFIAVGNFRLYDTTMKAKNFQYDILSIPIDNFKDHYLLVFDSTSIQEASESFHYPKPVGEPLRL